MINNERIKKAEKDFQEYIGSGQVVTKHKEIAQYVHFFLKNAETSVLTAQTLLEISESTEKKSSIGVDEKFESFLWVTVSSYYSMFYAALALFARHGIKVGDQSKHKVVADTLISQFIANRRLAKLLYPY